MASKRLILANGEAYVSDVKRSGGGGNKEYPRRYDEARERVRENVLTALDRLQSLPKEKLLKEEVVLCLRLHPDFKAKTYDPKALFVANRSIENVGSRGYRIPTSKVAPTKAVQKKLAEKIEIVDGRLLFVRGTQDAFHGLLRTLDMSEASLTKDFQKDIRTIEKIDLLSPDEQLLGFPEQWREGRVEIVLHPSNYEPKAQIDFLHELFMHHEVSWNHVRLAPYSDGPLFASCRITRDSLYAIAGSNPLRTAHPLSIAAIEDLRGSPTLPAPPAPPAGKRSTIKVGMFDGGVAASHQHLGDFVEVDNSFSPNVPEDPSYVAHGTAVAGALLYGPLNGKSGTDTLPIPPVSVVSFRALPTSDPLDIDLYECIDQIEDTVPQRTDIKTYNLSFGPRGPILDDVISRFTFALDRLSCEQDVSFFVAVGNDGEASDDLNRVQAPADIVNGIGVGAYTFRDGSVTHAPYSCHGPGRECGKIKPDLVGFGGCEVTPMHLLSASAGNRMLNRGTSFACPTVAAIGAQLTSGFDRGSSLLSRVLLIHTAKHPVGKPDHLFGHGVAMLEVENILRCDETSVTVVFQGAMSPTRSRKLPVMLPKGLLTSGKVLISYTVAGLPSVDSNHPADYTQACIEDTFFPNSRVFRFSRTLPGEKPKHKVLHVERKKDEIDQLETEGWKIGQFPASKSANRYRDETERRTVDCKWEPVVRREVSMLASSIEEPFILKGKMENC